MQSTTSSSLLNSLSSSDSSIRQMSTPNFLNPFTANSIPMAFNPSIPNAYQQQQNKFTPNINKVLSNPIDEDKDHVYRPDYKRPFSSLDDVFNRLSVYHIFQLQDQNEAKREIEMSQEAIRRACEALNDRKKRLEKYRSLLLYNVSNNMPMEECLFFEELLLFDMSSEVLQVKKEYEAALESQRVTNELLGGGSGSSADQVVLFSMNNAAGNSTLINSSKESKIKNIFDDE